MEIAMSLKSTPRRFLALAVLVSSSPGYAEEDAQELAKKLSNPIASMISLPFQFNYDGGYGPDDGQKAYVNVQPVIPFP